MDKGKGKKENKKQKEEPVAPVEEKKEEKPFTFWDIELTGLKHVFKENNVSEIARSTNQKASLIEFLTGYYESMKLKDLAEPNELSIIADFCGYNLEFAKERLRLSDDKAALLLNILFPFLSFKHLDKSGIGSYITDEEWTEERVKQLLEQKFEKFKETLLAFSVDNPPTSLKVFSTENLKEILEYATKTYFSHFPLFVYTMGKPQKVQDKQMTLFIDEPILPPPLKDGNLIVQKEKDTRPKGYEQKKIEEKKVEDRHEPKEERRKAEKKEDEEKSVEAMIESLSLSAEEKQSLYNKLKEMKDDVETKLTERQQKLQEKLEGMKPKGKGGKKPGK